MSDSNKKYNLDKDFLDRSWSDMESLLDKEMPVRKKKRRWLFFLFFLIGISMISISIYSMTDFREDKKLYITDTEEPKDEHAKYVPADKVESLIQNEIENTEKQNNSSTPNDPIKNNPEKQLGKNTRSNPVIRKNENIPSRYDLNYSKKELGVNDRAELEIISIEKKSGNNSSVIQKNENFQEELIQEIYEENLPSINSVKKNLNPFESENESKQKIELKLMAMIDASIKNKVEQIQLIENIVAEIEDGKEDEEKENKKWSLGIETGFQYSSSDEIGGKLGLSARYRFNSKWNLSLGGEYHLSRIDYSDEYLNVANVNLDENLSPGYEYDSLQNVINNVPKIMRHHKIKIPVMVGYRFSPRWQLDAGMALNVNLKSKNRDSAQELLGFDPLGTPAQNTSDAPPSITPLLDPQILAGVSYYPVRKLALGIRFDYGLIKRNLSAFDDEVTQQTQKYDLPGWGKRETSLGVFLRYEF